MPLRAWVDTDILLLLICLHSNDLGATDQGEQPKLSSML
jgi:hypothetical protein